MSRPQIGAHVSAAGGLWTAFDRAKEIGAECVQIFGSTPRSWSVKLPSAEEARTFKEAAKRSGVHPVYLHAPYLINLGSGEKRLFGASQTSLKGHLKIAEMLGAKGVIFHIGSAKGSTKEKAIPQIAASLKEILKEVPGKSLLILENAAGGGDKIGATPEEIADILKRVGSARTKVCFDTAHAFEAGMIHEYTPAGIAKLCGEWDKTIGLERIVVLHANDSKTVYNSHNDRHENIGEGYIGLAGFKALAKEQRLWNKDWILEVPGKNHEGPNKENIERLKSCFKK